MLGCLVMKVGIHGSGRDADLAQSIAGRLLQSLDVEVVVETGGRFTGSLGSFWDADLIVVLLSAESAPERWVREEWQRVLWEEPEENGSRVLCALTGDCRYPELMLRRRPRYRFHDARTSPGGVAAVAREWLMEMRRGDQPRCFLPGEDVQVVDEAVIEEWRRIVEAPGIAAAQGPAGSGKTDLAFEFVRRFHEEFEDVLWVSCAGRSAAEAAGEVGTLLGVKLEENTEACLRRLRRVMRERRLLMVLDGADRVGHLELLAEGWTSAVVTSRMDLAEFAPVIMRARKAARGEWPEALAACRKDALVPALVKRLGLEEERLQWLDRQAGWLRAAGCGPCATVPDRELEEAHASAVLDLANAGAGEQILADLFLATRRMLARRQLAQAAELARRAERICRMAHRMPEQAEILWLVAEAAWELSETQVCDSFTRDLVDVFEDLNDYDQARMWHARISRQGGEQLLLPMEVEWPMDAW